MTNLPEKKKNRTINIGFIAIMLGCLAVVLGNILVNWIQSYQNLCDWNSPYGCQNTYRVGGTVDIGESLAISADGRFLAISNLNNLMILDTDSGKVVASAKTGSDSNSNSYPVNVAISSNGMYAATIMNNNYVQVLSAEDGEGQFIESESPTIGSPYLPLFFSTDNKYLLFEMYNWQDDKTTIIRYDIEKKVSQPFIDYYNLLALSPDGKILAIQTADGIEFWRYSDIPYKVSQLPLRTKGIMRATISPNGNTIAVSFYLPDSNYYDATIQLIDIETKEVLYNASFTSSTISGLAFSPDGKYLLLHNCRASFTRVNEQDSLSGYETTLDLLDPLDFNISGTPTCSSNIVMDSNSKFMYFGSNGKIGRFDIPMPSDYEIFLENYTPEP